MTKYLYENTVIYDNICPDKPGPHQSVTHCWWGTFSTNIGRVHEYHAKIYRPNDLRTDYQSKPLWF